MGITNFEDLDVWEKSRSWLINIFAYPEATFF
jgi:hypothetical protein